MTLMVDLKCNETFDNFLEVEEKSPEPEMTTSTTCSTSGDDLDLDGP